MKDNSLYCEKHVADLIHKYIDLNDLGSGLPMWVSLYPSQGIKNDMKAIVFALLGADTADSDHIRVSDIETVDGRLKALLASAAIPLAYPVQEVEGKKYVDGGIGGWKKSTGNTPIKPLIGHGCKHVIVTHLSDGSLWDRYDYPDTTIIEIRPNGIARKGALGDLLGFEFSSIESWIEQGYEDTLRCIKPVKEALRLRSSMQHSELKRNIAIKRLKNDDFYIE